MKHIGALLALCLLTACEQPAAPCFDTVLVSGQEGGIRVWTINPCGQQLVRVDTVVYKGP